MYGMRDRIIGHEQKDGLASRIGDRAVCWKCRWAVALLATVISQLESRGWLELLANIHTDIVTIVCGIHGWTSQDIVEYDGVRPSSPRATVVVGLSFRPREILAMFCSIALVEEMIHEVMDGSSGSDGTRHPYF
jgi:hypothetical protein